MGHRLYYDSPYIKEWQTEVKGIIEKEGKYHITLAETAFYPGGGGQPSDRGTIDGIAVEDVYEKDNTVYHVLASAPHNKTVSCTIDMERRMDMMQQHTGQHLLSAILFNFYDCRTSSLHIGEEGVSLDLSLHDIPDETLKRVEDLANEYIYRDLPVKTHVVSPEEASKFPLRKALPKADTIRVVEIESADFSPCCGTHVTRTGEIGIIKIIRSEKMRGQTRIHFKCGRKALQDYRRKNEILLELSKRYSSEDYEILSRVEAQAEQLRNTQRELTELKEKMLCYDAGKMISSVSSKVIRRTFEDKRFDDINKLQQYILKDGDFIVILSSIPDKRLILAHSGAFDLDCGKIFREHLSKFNGKGGGKDKWANAGFGSVEDMARFEAFLNELASTK